MWITLHQNNYVLMNNICINQSLIECVYKCYETLNTNYFIKLHFETIPFFIIYKTSYPFLILKPSTIK